LSYCRSKARAWALLLGVAGLSVSPCALGQDWHTGVRAGVGVLSGRPGPLIGAHGAYGFGDMFDAIVEVSGSHHYGASDYPPCVNKVRACASGTDVFSASAGAAYKIDVFEWIPYVGLLAGYYDYAGAPGIHGEHGSRFGASVQIGVDYLLMRELALGAEIRWHASFEDGFSLPLFGATLGAEYRWGW
jgi:hypothetical protein